MRFSRIHLLRKRRGGDFPTPEISLKAVEAEVGETSIGFEITPRDASEAVYLIVKDGDALPTDDELFAKGRKADAKKTRTYRETGLTPSTKYTVLAAASNESGRSLTERLSIATKAPKPAPAVTLAPGTPTTSTLTFTLTPSDAEKAAYVCYREGETAPGAEAILRDGTQVDASAEKPYTVENLASNTPYIIAAAASKAGIVSERVEIRMTTLAIDPTLQLAIVEKSASTIRFSITPQRAEQVRYTFYKKGDTAPAADAILRDGIEADATAYGSYLVENLDAETAYVIAAVAAAGEERSDAITLEETTDAQAPPVMGDFYYSDGTWSSGAEEPLPDKTCIGIVFHAGRSQFDGTDDCIYYLKDGTTPLEEVRGYVVALNDATDTEVAWGSWDVDGQAGAGTSGDKTDFRGYSNTLSIRNKAIEKAGGLSDDKMNNYPACYYATDFYEQQVPAPASSTGWFLPSAAQLLYLFPNNETLKPSFDKLGDRADFFYGRDKQYWSSTESNKENGFRYWAYYTSLDSSMARPGFITYYQKYQEFFLVRSMLVF